MRRLLLLPFLAAALAACGSASSGKPANVAFGRTGGSIRPERFTIRYGGSSNPPAVLALDKKVRAVWSDLKSRQCPGALPDVATEYIRFEGRTVRVHGACEPAFTRLWNALSAAG